MIGSEGINPDVLGIEMAPTVVRAVRLNRESRTVVAAAECPVIPTTNGIGLDPAAVGPVLDDVMFQLRVDDRSRYLAGVSIGPERAGVGSGPALPGWLEHRARQLGENMICAGKLGIAFCPQRPLDTAIMICEQANITVTRIDFAPVAAARILESGIDTTTLGSGRGWRSRLRDDEVLEALESPAINVDQPLSLVAPDGVSVSVESYRGASIDPNLTAEFELNLGQLAPAVGVALGVIDGSAGNLLDGETVRGRMPHPGSPGPGVGAGPGLGFDQEGGQPTVDLVRPQVVDGGARSVIRQSGTVVEPPAGMVPPGRDNFDGTRQAGLEVHPDDPIRGFSPDPEAERSLHHEGRGMAAVVIALVLLSVAIAIAIYVIST